MRKQRKFHHHDTTEEPDIQLWVDQLNVVKVAASEASAWTLNLMTVVSGDIDGSAVAVGAYAERQIPGILAGHLYRVTITYASTLDDIEVTLGGVSVMTLDTGQSETKVAYVRPINSEPLKFSHDAGTDYTGAVTACSIEAMEPVDPVLFP